MMNKTHVRHLALAAALFLTACATSYPLGMAEDEWNRLTPAQQLDAREKQAVIDQAERERRAEAARVAAEQERRQQERYQERLRNAAPGEVVQCVLQEAEGYFGGNWRAAEPTGFTLLQGFNQDVSIARQDRQNRRLTAEARYDGAKVELCRPNRNECATLAATHNQLQRGVQVAVDLDRVVRGTLYCDTPRAHKTSHPRRRSQ